MTSFEYLLMGHLIGDFLLQTNWMARNKFSNGVALLIHALIYTLVIFLTTLIFIPEVPLWGGLLVFSTHYLLDNRTLSSWWLRHVMQVPDNEDLWLKIVVDQILHLLVLVIILHLK